LWIDLGGKDGLPTSGVESDTTRHALAIHQSAAKQLRPRSLAITEIS
jgi:hypothetical protein